MADPKTDSKSNAVSIALITGLLGVIGVAITAYFNYLNNRNQIELPIVVTQTAEARVHEATVMLAQATQTAEAKQKPRLTYEGYLEKGQGCVKTRDYGCALENFNAAIEINPDDVGGYWWRGFLYRSDGKYDDAISDFTKAISLSRVIGGDVSGAYFYLGLIYRDGKGDYSTSIDKFTKAIQSNPEFADTFCQRAHTYEHLNQKDKAINDYRDCLNFAIKTNNDFYKNDANAGLARLSTQP